MIDSHCHLFFNSLSDNLDQIIQNAKNNNITSILSINTKPNEFKNHYELLEKYKSVFLSYGLHPTDITSENEISKNDFIENCKNKKVIGIGETGLDFYHSDINKKDQYKIFEMHIEASYLTNLPLIIHQRNSEKEIMDIIYNYHKEKELNLVFHCFTGSENLLKFSLDNNFYISLSGIITFKNAENLRKTIKNISLSSLLLETDSPYLTPVPHRGKINEPSFVKYILDFLSIFFDINVNELEKITDDNFYKLFSKAKRYNELS